MKNRKKSPIGSIWLLIPGFALLMSLPFLVPHLGFLSLVGFVPLFFLDRQLRESGIRHAFWYYYAAFLLFNIAATFWIWFVSPVGAIAALILNALQMAAVFAVGRWGGRVIRRIVVRPLAAEACSLLFFIITWIAWEHIYFNIELSWPWLCLGNAFLYSTRLVQWYEVFGAVGGSAWILLCNAAIFLALIATNRPERRWCTTAAAALVCVPILCSEIRYATYQESQDPMEVVVIQPNIDPFTKYGVLPQSALDARLIELMEQETTPVTRYVITPETFTFNVDTEHPGNNTSIRKYQEFLRRHPDTRMLLGALTYRSYEAAAKPTRSARPRGNGQWIDIFNTAMVLDSANVYGQYYKSKLVPGVEIIPYEYVLPFLGPFIQKFGGSRSSYGTQDEMDALSDGDGRHLGAMICYESAYGDWSRIATRKGADFLTVMTNDGWWGDTPGYRQHFQFARLRAIENRRDVVQAANTGISGIIDQRGDVQQRTGWWVETTLRGTINGNDALTPFVRHGDRVGRTACRAFLVLLVGLLIMRFYVSDKRSGRDRSAAGKA
jgi:apolipoprotein N-acyltransferase